MSMAQAEMKSPSGIQFTKPLLYTTVLVGNLLSMSSSALFHRHQDHALKTADSTDIQYSRWLIAPIVQS